MTAVSVEITEELLERIAELLGSRPSAPRLGLTVEEAAEAVGMSESSFKRHVQPELRIIRRGRLRIIPVAEIERWLLENATFAATTRQGLE